MSSFKMISIFFLLVIANVEWIFIWMNYQIFAKLQEIGKQSNINYQKEYLEKIERGVPVHLENFKKDDNIIAKRGMPVHLENNKEDKQKENTYRNFIWFKPYKINIPSIDIESPVYNTNRNIETLLNKWVVNFSENKKWFYIFWHSSSKIDSPFAYIFTKIPKLDKWDIVFLEDEYTTKLYEYKWYTYKKSDELSELEDLEWKVYLITCYPFNTSITRYVAEFEFIKKIEK